MRQTRDFHTDLQWSTDAGCEAFWLRVYLKAFPTMTEIRPGQTLDEQRIGIDRVITLANGATIRVDEKKRREVWPDILLETISNIDRETPGWMEKDLAIDYLAYAFLPIYRVHLYPWAMLRRAWLYYRTQWIGHFKTKLGTTDLKNGGHYNTANIAVPIEVLKQAVSRAAIIDAPPDEPEQPLLPHQLALPLTDTPVFP